MKQNNFGIVAMAGVLLSLFGCAGMDFPESVHSTQQQLKQMPLPPVQGAAYLDLRDLYIVGGWTTGYITSIDGKSTLSALQPYGLKWVVLPAGQHTIEVKCVSVGAAQSYICDLVTRNNAETQHSLNLVGGFWYTMVPYHINYKGYPEPFEVQHQKWEKPAAPGEATAVQIQ